MSDDTPRGPADGGATGDGGGNTGSGDGGAPTARRGAPDRGEEAFDRPGSAFLERFKEFGPTSLATRHRTSVLVLFAIIAVAGTLSYLAIPKEAQPEIEIPMVSVSTVYPGVSPADMETLVTRPLEEELNTIPDLKELRSVSVEGYSNITAEFETSMDMNEALQRVREKVDLARSELPADAEDPTINEFNLSEMPVMQVNLSGEYGLVRLKELGEEMQERLEQIPSVLRADLHGGLEREVRVDVHLSRLKYYGLSLDDLVEAIRDENVNVPGGSIDVGSQKYLVRVDGEFADPEHLADIVVVEREGRPVYLRDLADVEFGFAERESFARLDGVPVVTLDVVKRSGENIIETADAVERVIADMEPLFPPTTAVKITSDQSEDIHTMVSSLENNIVSGLILIVAVLLFFLGTRTSVFVAISIPTSMLLSFLGLWMAGVTMNMVVLFSLILALGMLVDNAIVVVENIYRYMEEGWDRVLAARKATGEVAPPVIGATLTTLAAFAPLLFWPGLVGEFMGFLPLTLIVTLSSSLFVALVILPVLCAMFMAVEEREEKGLRTDARALPPESAARTTGPRPGLSRAGKWGLGGLAAALLVGVGISNPFTAVLLAATVVGLYALNRWVLERLGRSFRERVFPALLRDYERRLRWALRHRFVVVGGAAAAFVATFVAFGVFSNGVEFFPEDIPPAQALVSAETPDGSRASFTDEIVRDLEGKVRTLPGMEDAESRVATVGSSGGGFFGGGQSGANEGRITVSFVDFRDRRHDAFATVERMQARLGEDVAGAEVAAQTPDMGPPSGAPVNIEVVGEDPATLKDLSDRIVEVLRNAPVGADLVGLESDMDAGRPELGVRVDREKAALYDLSTREVGWAIRGAIQGIEAGHYRTGNDEYDIVVRLAERDRAALSDLENLVVSTDLGTQVPLLSVADWSVGEGYASIRRVDMDRVATISSDVRAGVNSNAALAEVQRTLAGFQADELPPGYSMRYTGQSEEQQEAQSFLTTAFLAALMLIGFILVTQFNSIATPVIILTSVIMSTVGVLIGLMVFDMPFVIVMTGVGIISLAGIVVNNAIVLIDYIDILRERDGLDRFDALVEGGKTRYRPVVLTAITTALGLVPLAIGLNFDFFGLYGSLSPDLYWGGEQAAWWGPMAVAVIVGILVATVLTLGLVPVLYSLVDDAVILVRRTFLAPTAAPSGDAGTAGVPLAAGGAGEEATRPAARERPRRGAKEASAQASAGSTGGAEFDSIR